MALTPGSKRRGWEQQLGLDRAAYFSGHVGMMTVK